MDKLILKGLIEVEEMKFYDIEGGFGESKKAILVRDIANIHDRDLKDINRNINNNIKRFKNGVDILDLKNGGSDSPLEELGFSKRDISVSNNIYLLSERGYSKLLKILEDDFAWEQYEKLVDGYFNMRETIKHNNLEVNQLSPELQMFKQIFDSVARQQLEQQQIKASVEETKEEVQAIRDVVTINPKAAWRRECNRILNAIGKKVNNYSLPKDEVYQALKERGNCRPNVLINNLKKRAQANGMAPSKVEKINILDVLENETSSSAKQTCLLKIFDLILAYERRLCNGL